MQTNQIALQLYTVRDHTAKDMVNTLRRIAEMGYQAVEFAGYGDAAPHDIRAALDEHGLRTVSAHVGLQALQTQPARVFADLQTLGCAHVVVPSVGAEHRDTAAQVRQLAQLLNQLGAQCRQVGLQLGYHNHAFEFAALDGGTMWDVLTAATDPALVTLELDVYWAQYAGVDPIALIQQGSGRMPLLHIKDMAADAARADVTVGEGMFSWPDIFRAGAAAGTQWYIVEQDNPREPLRDVERSLRYLQQLALDDQETHG
jgi:sugar phosphate isomerase/epimerase